MAEAETQPTPIAKPRFTLDEARLRVIAVSVALFAATFLSYWYLGPQETVYGFQVSQANNIIHGHLEMAPQYTKNLNILERVLYDGEGFCFPPNDPKAVEVENPRFSEDCKTYMQHSLGPAFMEIPGVLLFGNDLNQTLVSVVFAGMTAVVVYHITRKFSDSLLTQVSLTVLVMFGTILWWVGSNGGVWFFAHTTAVFFAFCTIYATVVMRNPLAAGAMAGAAFMCRPTMLMSGIFPLVALSDQWLVLAKAPEPLWKSVKLKPLLLMAGGVAPFIIATMVVNFLRFDNPFETGYNYTEQLQQTALKNSVYNHGLLHLSYIQRHMQPFWEQTPIFSREGSYIWPSWFATAMWITTPAFFVAYFVHVKEDRKIALWATAALALACAIIITRGLSLYLGWFGDSWGTRDIPWRINLLPFWVMIAVSIGLAVKTRDRLVIACWAAIIPLTMANWIFAATGWAQFGYRYGLDFMPFLWLLVVLAVGKQVKWYHLALILAAIAVNLWGVLWIYQFAPHATKGWTWVSF